MTSHSIRALAGWTPPRLPLFSSSVWGARGQDVEVQSWQGFETLGSRFYFMRMMCFCQRLRALTFSMHWGSL